MNHSALPIAVLVASAVAAFTDARSGRIPNALTLSAAALGLTLQGMAGKNQLVASVVGLAVAGAVPWILHRVTNGRGIGGGDVKLFAALGAMTGPLGGLDIELGAFVVLAVFALVRLAFAGALLRVLVNTLRVLANPVLPQSKRRPIDSLALTEMRLGPAIFVSALGFEARALMPAVLPWLF